MDRINNWINAELMCLKVQKLPRPEVFLTRAEVLAKLEDGTLKAGDAYAHNLPLDTWLTVTNVSESGFTAHDQVGWSESVYTVPA